MRIGSSGEQVFVQTGNEFLGRIRKIARHLLLDPASLLSPFRLTVLNVPHAGGVHAQNQIQVLGRDSIEILRNVLLRISIGKPAQLRIDGCNLVPAQVRASAECHVLLGMRHSWKAGRGLIPASEVIFFHRYYGGQRIANNYDAQSISQRCAGNVHRCARFVRLAAGS